MKFLALIFGLLAALGSAFERPSEDTLQIIAAVYFAVALVLCGVEEALRRNNK